MVRNQSERLYADNDVLMADLSDVTAYLATAVATAVYPNGTSQPSVAAMDCRIYEGWPIPDQLDRDMLGQMMSGSPPMPVTRPGGTVANVSVFAMQGTGSTGTLYQQLDKTYVITPPVITSTFTLVGNLITVTGQIGVGEYLTLVIDNAVVCSQTGASTAAMLAALAAQAVAAGYPGTIATATTLTVPLGHALVVRQGGAGVLGKVTHRQRQSVMVTVWAPTQVARSTLAGAIDNVIKQKIKVAMPDTSQALVIYSRTNVLDDRESTAIYRRDLIYDVEYATVFQFPGYVVTSVNTTIHTVAPATGADATSLT
jgi:hypothetical protein